MRVPSGDHDGQPSNAGWLVMFFWWLPSTSATKHLGVEFTEDAAECQALTIRRERRVGVDATGDDPGRAPGSEIEDVVCPRRSWREA